MKILSCPFCAASPIVTFRKLFKTYSVRCDTPGCELEFGFTAPRNHHLSFFKEEDAIEAWNTRPTPTESEIVRRTW